MKTRKLVSLVAGIASAGSAVLMAGSASALVQAYLYEDGSDVVGYFSGSLDLTGMVAGGTLSGVLQYVNPSSGYFVSLDGYDYYTGLSGAASFGGGGYAYADSRSGDGLAFVNGALGVEVGYVSGTEISGTMTFLGTTLGALGALAGVYNYNLPNDQIVLTVGSAPSAPSVPLPASLPLLAAGVGALGLARRKRRK